VRESAQAVAAQLPAQAEFSGSRPAATKLAVDPFLRIVGARDALALGDCAMMHGNRLPATAQARARPCSKLRCCVNGGPQAHNIVSALSMRLCERLRCAARLGTAQGALFVQVPPVELPCTVSRQAWQTSFISM